MHTRFGKWTWEKFISFVRNPFVWKSLVNAYSFWNLSKDGFVCLNFLGDSIDRDFCTERKKALVILPFYGKNATTQNVERIMTMLMDKEYELHLFLYWEHPQLPCDVNNEIWDRVFVQKSINKNFAKTKGTRRNPDVDHIDDWIGDDFLQTIRKLEEHYHYSVCFVNYIFFTKAFSVLPSEVKKITITHDILMQRNTRLKQAGESPKDYWFSLASEQEEAKALLRGDVVFGVQEEDTMYFKRITQNKIPVLTVPFLPPQHFLQRKESPDTEHLRVGYLASNNAPNISAISKLIKTIGNDPKVIIFVGGAICGQLRNKVLSQNVVFVGIVEELDKFYGQFDLYVNPDTFYSGLKCKTVEAISYGCPLVCTKVASTGIGLTEEYHLLEDECACGKYIKNLVLYTSDEKIRILNCLKNSSEKGFKLFQHKFDDDYRVAKIVVLGKDEANN